MVRVASNTLAAKAGAERAPFVVDLVGPAAAGKTSLLRALTQSSGIIVKGPDLELREIWPIPLFVRNTLLMLPFLYRQSRNGRGFTWSEIKSVAYLEGWHQVLRRQAANGTITILDNGPVFMLARLRISRPENIRSRAFDGWWEHVLKRWAHTLEMIIWLEAPEEVLLERRQARNRSRVARREKSEEEAAESLARYRNPLDYESVVSALTADQGTRLLRFDTGKESLEEITDQVLAALDVARDKT